MGINKQARYKMYYIKNKQQQTPPTLPTPQLSDFLMSTGESVSDTSYHA